MFDFNIDTYHTIDMIIDAYNQAQEKVEAAFGLLHEAKKILRRAVGNYKDSVVPHGCTDYDLPYEAKKSKEMIKRNVWKYLVDKTQVKNILSDAKTQALDKQLHEEELPELTHSNVHEFVSNLSNNIEELFNESLEETFNFLRPRRNQYKSNSEYQIGKKIVLEGLVSYSFEILSLSYYYESKLVSLDNAFHLLDGKGHIKYPYDAVTQIKQAMQEKKWECDTEYFHFKWYKKGTLHVEFKRPDLVTELNKIGGKGKLNRN